MTVKEAKFIEAKAQGKNGIQAAMIATGTKNKAVANMQAGRMMKKPAVKTELERLLKQQGITLKKALKPIGEALEAEKLIAMGKDENSFIDRIPDYAVRLKAADMSLKLLGIKTSPKPENIMSQNITEQIPTNLDEVELSRAVFRKSTE